MWSWQNVISGDDKKIRNRVKHHLASVAEHVQTTKLSVLNYNTKNYTYLCILLGLKVLVYYHQKLILRNYRFQK